MFFSEFNWWSRKCFAEHEDGEKYLYIEVAHVFWRRLETPHQHLLFFVLSHGGFTDGQMPALTRKRRLIARAMMACIRLAVIR